MLRFRTTRHSFWFKKRNKSKQRKENDSSPSVRSTRRAWHGLARMGGGAGVVVGVGVWGCGGWVRGLQEERGVAVAQGSQRSYSSQHCGRGGMCRL